MILKLPSRKKAKAKARKAKTKECNLILHDNSVCRHGCESISKEDLCYKFVKQFEVELSSVFKSCQDHLLDSCSDAIDRLKDSNQFNMIWDDETIQKRLIPLFINLGVNLLLKNNIRFSQKGSMVAMMTELCRYNFDVDKVLGLGLEKSRRIVRDLEDGMEYDLTKYFIKKIPCGCLQKMFFRVKSNEVRTGICDGCGASKERTLLYLCGRCRYHSYCSIICQRSDYPKHLSFCKEFSCYSN